MKLKSIAPLAIALPLLAPLPALAKDQELAELRLHNSLTASGFNMAARYLDRVGDVDLNLLGGYVNFPSTGGSLAGGQFALQARLAEALQLTANMGPLTEIGLRGPLWRQEGLTFGWDAHYRSDLYLYLEPGFGLARPMGGMVPFPGAQGNGAELGLNAMSEWNGLSLYATPLLSVMSNRSAAGLIAGVDATLGRWEMGLAGEYRNNWHNPAGAGAIVVPNELAAQAGMRYFLNDRSFLQGYYRYAGADSYGIPAQQVLFGMGMRLIGTVQPKSEPTPEPTPVPAPTPTPVPAPEPTPIVLPTPKVRAGLEGRIVVPGSAEGKTLVVQLKRETPRGFVNIDTQTTADANGYFMFLDLEPGNYQAVYRSDGQLPGTAGVAVSEAVKVTSSGMSGVDLDVAWDEATIRETLTGDTQEVSWSLKPSAPDAFYQVIVRTDPNDSKTDMLSFPESPTDQNSGKFKVTDMLKGKKVYYFIKYWKKTGAFNGASFYGQSKVRTFEFK